MSIRTRLTLGVALLLIVAFTLLGAVIVGITQTTLIDQVDARILATMTRFGGSDGRSQDNDQDNDGERSDNDPDRLLDQDDHSGSPVPDETSPDLTDLVKGVPTPAAMVYEQPVARLEYGPDGTLQDADPSGYPDAPDPLPASPPLSGPALDQIVGQIITLPALDGELSYRALVDRRPDGEIVVIAAPLSAVDDAIARIIQAVVIAAGLTLVLTVPASGWLIRVGLRPVDQMIETAAGIANGDLSRRVPDANPRTELGQLGAALNVMLTQIEQALAARAASEGRLRRFVADAAHELRTPLTSLRGYAELYRQGALPTPDAVASAMGRIESEGARMARLVDDLLLLARLDQQRGIEREPVDLVTIVRDATTDFAVVAPDWPIDVSLVATAIVLGDRGRLRQVVDNLLTNIRIHTPPGTRVHVTVQEHSTEAELIIADEGPGISPDAQTKIFERFWRADASRVRSRGGSGLGLAIVTSLVDAHGGSVRVMSEVGKGATFIVRLPLASMVAMTDVVSVAPKQ